MIQLKGRSLKSSILNSNKWRSLKKQKQTLPVSAIIAKSQDIGRKIVTSLSTPDTFRPLTSLSNSLLTPSDGALRNYRGSSKSSLLIGLKKPLSRLEMNLSMTLLTPELHSQCSTPLLLNSPYLRVLKGFK